MSVQDGRARIAVIDPTPPRSHLPPIGPTVAEELEPWQPVSVLRADSDKVLGNHHLRPGDHVILSPKKTPRPGELVAIFIKGQPAPYLGVLVRDLPRYHKDPDPATGCFTPVEVDYMDGYGVRHYGGSPLDCVMGVVAIVSPVLCGEAQS